MAACTTKRRLGQSDQMDLISLIMWLLKVLEGDSGVNIYMHIFRPTVYKTFSFLFNLFISIIYLFIPLGFCVGPLHIINLKVCLNSRL